VKNGLLALHLFDEGEGDTVHDVSGVGDPLNLTLRYPDRVTWLSDGIRAGETIVEREATPHRLVTLSEVEACWSDAERERFRTHAWPLTDETWVVWGRNPDDWMPIDHSCDPNAWLQGLNLVARRSIRLGEEITVDYATLFNERMPAFACRCETPMCRGTIRGSDYLADFVDRYGEHVSDYVRAKRAERPGVHRHGAA